MIIELSATREIYFFEWNLILAFDTKLWVQANFKHQIYTSN